VAASSTKTKTRAGLFSLSEGVRHLWASPWTGWVGLRYLKSKKNSRFLSFITLISILGVSLGVTAMVVVLSVMDGFEAELKKRLMSSDLHVLITPTTEVEGFEQGFVPKSAIADAKIQSFMLAHPEVESFWPMVTAEAILRAGKKMAGIVVKGTTPGRLAKLKSQATEQADERLLMQQHPEAGQGAPGEGARLPGLWLGQELAFELGVIPGDVVSLVSPIEMEGPLSSVPRMRRFVIEGIYHSGLPEQELHHVFATDAAVRSFLRRADVLSQWEVSVKDFDQAPNVAAAIREVFPGFQVRDWMQMNSHLFASLRLERIAMFVILIFIIVVASFNIVTTLTLMVLEKKREISILRAMGARAGQVAAIFLWEGVLIGVGGVGGGVALAWIVCSALRRYEFIQLPDIYYDRTLPVTFDPVYYALVSISALLIVLFVCLYPSRRAAQLNPLDGIRFG
jgi:lipoprotein-releasing system permease protein